MINRIKKNKLFIRIIMLAVISSIFFLGGYKLRYKIKPVINKIVVTVFDKQNVIVEFPPEIDKSDIEIVWYGNYSEQQIILNSKVKWDKIPEVFGNNCFVVYYKDSIINTVGHLKISKFKYHNYLFRFKKDSNKVSCDFNVLGADSVYIKKWDELYHWTKSLSSHYQINSPLSLQSNLDTIKNIIEFEFDTVDFKNLLNTKIETKIKDADCKIYSKPLIVKSVKTRGVSSMYYRRKSFNVKLNDSLLFKGPNGITKKIKSFSLISLSMDQYYFKNRIAYELLNEIIGMDIFHTFSEVKINSQSQGVYLLIENPKDYLVDSKQARFILRRRYECSSFRKRNNIEDAYLDYKCDKTLDSIQVYNILEQYRNVYRVLNTKKEEELYDSLNAIMNIREYMRIMAFNFIICNGDYSDEQFFYINDLENTNRFNILPWDFDDIFLNSPHEGWRLRNQQINDNKLIFSIENDLDLTIAKDPFLYQQYLLELENVVNIFTNVDLRILFQNTYNELYPFYQDSAIISQSKFDQYSTEYKITGLENQLIDIYQFLLHRIETIRYQINMEKKYL